MRERNVIFILIGIALIVLAGYLGAIYYLKISESKIPGVPAGTTSLAELKANYKYCEIPHRTCSGAGRT